ncbi:hypothetical protein HX056_00935 [Myroides odoratimimus]|uniref:hypothetical protein n=1 Tax=Myroides odoratimimus TaxID=76832 RepID=UPI0025757AA9|nr:hypothetical protein [Myroides odoratimimus]MDM1441903.1 hypothetical protein [Myroides odoratimimus]
MAKQTEQQTSPAQTGEVNTEGTTTPQDTVDTTKQAEEKAKQEKEALKKAEQEANKKAEEKAKQEKEALKKAEQEAQKLAKKEANERLLNGYEYRGRKYNFTANMPQKVNLDGEIFSQEEIMSNTDVIESMIDSKNIFIKEI